jgi:iron complex outermembrane receptor protein
LNEVVIQVGYGTVKKDATGAVTVFDIEDFNKGPVTSADQIHRKSSW